MEDKNPPIDLDKTKVFTIGETEVHPNENPIYYNGRDITVDGKQTLRNAVDIESYQKWIKLQRKRIYNEGKFFTSEDGLIVINLADFPHRVTKKMDMLSDDDREKANEQLELVQAHRAKIIQAQTKAFGYGSKKHQTYKVNKTLEDSLKENKDKILELFGRMFTPEEVRTVMVRDWKQPMSLKALVNFRKQYLDEITKLIQTFREDFTDIRLTEKRGRLEEMVWIYNKAKDSFIATGSKSDREFLLRALDSVRKEVEGDKIRIDGNLDIKIEQTITHQIQKEIFTKTNLTQIILGRVAARMNVNPLQIISDMQNNVYAKFNGMLYPQDSDTIDIEYQDLIYPSAMPYDFNMIEQAQPKLKESRDAIKAEIIENKDRAKAIGQKKGTKDILLKALGNMKQENNKKATEMDFLVLDKKVAAEEKLVAESQEKASKDKAIEEKFRAKSAKEVAKVNKPIDKEAIADLVRKINNKK